MAKTKFSLALLFLSFITMASAQYLEDHLWKNRILVVIDQAEGNPIFRQQLQALVGLEAELQDRKMLVYQVKEDQYKIGLHSKEEWLHIRDPKLISIVEDAEGSFQVVLIGLDGGVKRRQSKIMISEDLFDMIDRMPMRRQELRNAKGE